jgi:hypothetical protein
MNASQMLDFFTIKDVDNNTIMYEKTVSDNSYQHVFYINNVSIKKMQDTGSYIIIVKDLEKNGPTGVFAVSKSMNTKTGNIVSLCYSDGENSSFHLEWNPCEYPSVIVNFKKYIIKSKVRYNISVF